MKIERQDSLGNFTAPKLKELHYRQLRSELLTDHYRLAKRPLSQENTAEQSKQQKNHKDSELFSWK